MNIILKNQILGEKDKMIMDDRKAWLTLFLVYSVLLLVLINLFICAIWEIEQVDTDIFRYDLDKCDFHYLYVFESDWLDDFYIKDNFELVKGELPIHLNAMVCIDRYHNSKLNDILGER